MAREISVSFALTAALKGGFKAAFQSAADSARNVASAIRQMERTPVGKLGASMTAQREKIKGLAGSLKEAKATLAALNAQAQASGGATGMLARQIELAERRVNNMSGALTRQLGQWRATTAEAATVSGSVRRLAQDYDHLSQRMDRMRRVQTAMAANRAQADALRAQRSDLNGRLAGAVATAMTVAAPVKLSVDFEDAIARVGAVANASAEDMQRLTETARQLGRDTSFSASQAAEGMKYLAMAGFDAKETIAAMPGMLDLAAAGNTDLGRTADIASDILSAFKLKASDMGQVSDTLAKTFTTSNTSLEMLGETMKYVGPVAASTGMSLQDTSAMAGMLGNVGIKASQAGTVLRAALLRLAAPPKMAKDALGELAGVAGPELDELYDQIGDTAGAQDALKELGMTTKDQAGNMRPLVDILEELNARTADMGTAEKAEVFKKIFGTEASAGMIALAEQASITVDKYGNKITNALGEPTNAMRKYMETVGEYEGTGARIAKRMNETTGGALRRLKSAWEDTGISIGNLFLPAIQAGADALAAISNVISGAIQRFPLLSRGIGLAVGAIAAFSIAGVGLGLVMNLVRTSINSWRGALLRLSAAQITSTATTGAATVSAGAFGVASNAAGIGARFFAGGLRSILLASGVGAILVGLGYAVGLLIDHWDDVVEAMRGAWQWVVDTWGRLGVFFSELGNNLAGIFSGVWDGISGIAIGAWETVTAVWGSITSFFASVWNGIGAGAEYVWGWITDTASSVVGGIEEVWNGVVDFFSGIVDSIKGVFGGLFAWLEEKFAWVFKAFDGISSFIGSVTGAVKNAWNAAKNKKSDDTAAPAAEGAKNDNASKNASKKKEKQGFTPVSASSVNGGGAQAPKGKSGRKSRGGGGGGGSRSAGGSSSKSGGPVTIVSVAGDNAQTQTIFIPAGSRPSAAPNAARSASSGTSASIPALPQAPALISGQTGKKKFSGGPGTINIDLKQEFDLIAQDAVAVRKVLESIKPDMEALIRRALEKIQSDKRRTAYAQ